MRQNWEQRLQAAYAANRLRVIRQVRYSLHSENSIDLVLFVNGIAVATVELKSDYTQSVQDAIDQYRFDRPPKAPGRNTPEPLLAFPGGALVHFAVSNSEVYMSTKLASVDSVFLPFNRGHDFGGGNPSNPDGAPTAYLWEDVWQRDGWLEILGRYLVPVKDDKRRLARWIFPRFHQLDAVRKLVAQVLADGPGGRYLIEQQIPTYVAGRFLHVTTNPLVLLLFINLFLMAVHAVLETVSSIVVVLPVFIPLLTQMHMDPVAFGIIVLINSAIGINLPRIGFCLYSASSVSGVPLEKAARAIMPFILALSIDLAVIVLFPQIPLFLPHLAGMK